MPPVTSGGIAASGGWTGFRCSDAEASARRCAARRTRRVGWLSSREGGRWRLERPAHVAGVDTAGLGSGHKYARYCPLFRGVRGSRVTFAGRAASGEVAADAVRQPSAVRRAAALPAGRADPCAETAAAFGPGSGRIRGVCPLTPEARHAARSRANAGGRSWPSRGSACRLASGGGRWMEGETAGPSWGWRGYVTFPAAPTGPSTSLV